MNGRRAGYASVAAAAVVVASLAPACAPAQPQGATAGAIAAAEQPAPLPTFASIPPAPTDVRPFDAWRSAIVELKGAGVRVAAEAAAEPWVLRDTEGWAARERSEGTAPPPVTTPSEGDTEAFVATMRARAIPPPRAHPAEAPRPARPTP
ncbi:MAG TPA: hypothetical protein VMT68_07925 [Caulobacteraceae bacterium]|nr:hypothetical protein [Caulobacteraceae bacterium]